MRYTPQTPSDQEQMLRTIGLSRIEELVEHIPRSLREKAKISLPEGLTEVAVKRRMAALAAKKRQRPGLELLSRRRNLQSLHSERG